MQINNSPLLTNRLRCYQWISSISSSRGSSLYQRKCWAKTRKIRVRVWVCLGSLPLKKSALKFCFFHLTSRQLLPARADTQKKSIPFTWFSSVLPLTNSVHAWRGRLLFANKVNEWVVSSDRWMPLFRWCGGDVELLSFYKSLLSPIKKLCSCVPREEFFVFQNQLSNPLLHFRTSPFCC